MTRSPSELRGIGFELDETEIQTTPRAAVARARRQKGARARDGLDRPRPGGSRARRSRRRRRADRRLRRDARAEPGLQLHEPRACVQRDPGWRVLLLPAQEPLVADEPRPDARLRGVRRRARVRDRDRGDRARQAEPRLLRGGARRARRRARADLARHRRHRRRRSRRAAVRHAHGARAHRQVPARRSSRRRRSCPRSSSARSRSSRSGSSRHRPP